jgi:hypothetical protein
MRAAGDNHLDAAYWLGRGAVAAVALVLLGLALLLLWDPAAGAVSLAGAALYVTAAVTRAAIPSALSSQPTPALRR